MSQDGSLVWIRTSEGDVVQMPRWLVPTVPCADGSMVKCYGSQKEAIEGIKSS